MIREAILEDADAHFIGKTDAQILRMLAASWGHRVAVAPDEQSGHRSDTASMAEDGMESQPLRFSDEIVKLAA